MKNWDGFVDSVRNLKSLLFPFYRESVSAKMKSKPTCAPKKNIQLKVDANMLARTKRDKREAPDLACEQALWGTWSGWQKET